MRWRGAATCQRYTDEESYNHRYAWLAFNRYNVRRRQPPLLGLEAHLPAGKGCVDVRVCVRVFVCTGQLELQLVLPVTKNVE